MPIELAAPSSLSKEYRVFFWMVPPCFFSRALLEGGGLRGAEAGFVAVSCGGETSEETSEKPFFTLDLAKRKDGGWIILEWGDGQVSGLPDRADVVVPFYEKIKLANIGRGVT
ncbi:ATP-grasp domain-containing protein [Brevibacillus gelatini]